MTSFWLLVIVLLSVYSILHPVVLTATAPTARSQLRPRTGLAEIDITGLQFYCEDCICPSPNRPCGGATGVKCCHPVACARTRDCTMSREEAQRISRKPLGVDAGLSSFFGDKLGGGLNPTKWFETPVPKSTADYSVYQSEADRRVEQDQRALFWSRGRR